MTVEAVEPVVEAVVPAAVVPLGDLESVADFRARRDVVEPEPVAAPAPVVEPVVAAEPDPASEAGKALAAKKGSLQARIDEITRKAAQREAELLAAIAAHKVNKPADTPAKAASEAVAEHKRVMALPGAPKETDFETYAEFMFASSVFVNDVRAAERDAKQSEAAGAQHASEAQTRAYEAGKAAHADFDEAMQAFVDGGGGFGPVVRDVILNHDLGAEFAYALAKDPALSAKIEAIKHPGRAMLEIGKVLAGLEGKAATPVVKPAPVSKAPAPVAPVTGEAPAGVFDPSASNSVADFRRHRSQFVGS